VAQPGFLGTTAPWTADVTLLLEWAIGIGLLAGALLARAGRYRLPAACQSVNVLLNLILIVLAMFPSFHRQVLPKLPSRIGRPYYALAATHAAMGTVAELLALYLLLAAGRTFLPEKLRLRSYKIWMRGVLFLWWIVLFVGIATYVR
jgi:uncharacterized membrane protein YozB (DUF420 family)